MRVLGCGVMGLVLLMGACSSSAQTPGGDGGSDRSDAGGVPDAPPAATADALVEAPLESADAPLEASVEATPADASDGPSDDGPAVGGLDGGSGDAGENAGDAAERRWIVVSCQFQVAGSGSVRQIASDGTMYARPGALQPVPAGGLSPLGDMVGRLDPPALTALLAAARALDSSQAGYTTQTGPNTHNNARTGELDSAGAPGHSVRVDFYENGAGFTPPHQTIIRHDDPAAGEIRKYTCINFTI